MPLPQANHPPRRALLRDDVHTRLRDPIVDGTLLPGEQLRDQELAAWLGVSRTPVREALQRLGKPASWSRPPGRSTTVATLDARGVRDAQAVVAADARLAVAEAVTHLGPEDDFAAMREANARSARP